MKKKKITKREEAIINTLNKNLWMIYDEYEEATDLWDLQLMNENLFNKVMAGYTKKTKKQISDRTSLDILFRKKNAYIIMQGLTILKPFLLSEEISRELDPYFFKIEQKDIYKK